MKASVRKIPLLLGFLILFSTVSFGQVIKLKTTSISIKTKINETQWGEWSAWEDVSILIVLDLDKERFTIYSKETQIYDVAENEGNITDKDGDDIWSFFCVNEDGLTCRVKLIKLNSQDGSLQLYVDFSDMRWVYNVYSLD